MSNYGRVASGGNMVFFGIRQGKDSQGRTNAVMVRKVDGNQSGAIATIGKDGKQTVNAKTGELNFHQEFDYLSGRISKLEKRVWESNGKKRQLLDISIDAPGETLILSLDRGSSYWIDFLNRLINVDLEKDVCLRAFKIERKDKPGKFNEVLCIYQDPSTVKGKLVHGRWNRDNNWGNNEQGEGGMPPAVPPNPDNDKWSFTRRDRWIEETVVDQVAKELEAIQQTGHPQQPEITAGTANQLAGTKPDVPEAPEFDPNMEDDGLPF
jgi:hypothetical protein